MAKPAHTRVVFSGVLGTVAAPLERWAFSVNFPSDAIPANATEIVANQVAASCIDHYHLKLNPHLPADVICTMVKVSRVGADGKVAKRGDGSLIQGIWTGSAAGAGASQPVPAQTALVVSLETARYGATGKGRYFLPWPAKGIVAGTKRLAVGDVNALVTANKDFLNALTAVMTFAPQVVSSKGYMSEVTGLRIGRVPDTMRSRREDLVEEYVHTPLA